MAGCDGKLHVIDVDRGKTITTIDVFDPTLSTPALLGDHAYFGTEGGNFFAISWKEPKVTWKYPRPQSKFAFRCSAAVNDKLVVVGGRDKKLHGIDRASGKGLWTFATRGRIDSSPVIEYIRPRNVPLFENGQRSLQHPPGSDAEGDSVAVGVEPHQELGESPLGRRSMCCRCRRPATDPPVPSGRVGRWPYRAASVAAASPASGTAPHDPSMRNNGPRRGRRPAIFGSTRPGR